MNLLRTFLIMFTLLAAQNVTAQPLVRIFELQIDPAGVQAFYDAGRLNMQTSNREEQGVLAMYAVASQDKPGLIYVFEMYADDDAYLHHIGTRHYKNFINTTLPLIRSKHLIEIDPVFVAEKPTPLLIMQRGKSPEVRIVEVTVKHEDLAKFRRIVTEEMRESMKAEPGVLAMYAVTRKGNVDQWIFFEIYADAAAYASHRETQHFKDYLRLTDDMLVDKSHVSVESIALQNRGGLVFDVTQ